MKSFKSFNEKNQLEPRITKHNHVVKMYFNNSSSRRVFVVNQTSCPGLSRQKMSTRVDMTVYKSSNAMYCNTYNQGQDTTTAVPLRQTLLSMYLL